MGNQVYGDSIVISKQPTVSSAATAYASGDEVGGIQTLAAGHPVRGVGTVILQSVTVVDAAKQSAPFDILFFSADPTGAGDNAACDITDAAMYGNCLGRCAITNDDYTDLTSNSVGTVNNIGLAMAPAAASTIWALPVIQTGATYTDEAYDLTFRYTFFRDL